MSVDKKITLVVLFIFAFLFQACEENFSPKAEFEEQYFMYCVSTIDPVWTSTYARVYIFKTFDVDGFDPYALDKAPTVDSATVFLEHRQFEYPLLQTMKPSFDSSWFEDSISCYVGGAKIPGNSNLSITAILPNGKKLYAETTTAYAKPMSFSFPFTSGFRTNIDKFFWGDEFVVEWTNNENHVFFPEASIIYAGIDSLKQKIEVPLRYIKTNGGHQPYYPTFTQGESIGFDYDAFDSTMAKISEGDPEKSNYTVYDVEFRLKEYDTPLSNYFSTINGALDEVSVRIDKSMYTNIIGGYGVFGSMAESIVTFTVHEQYAEKFGYKLGR